MNKLIKNIYLFTAFSAADKLAQAVPRSLPTSPKVAVGFFATISGRFSLQKIM
jgi:hypothetical protein